MQAANGYEYPDSQDFVPSRSNIKIFFHVAALSP
jgi:hypothetical protein